MFFFFWAQFLGSSVLGAGCSRSLIRDMMAMVDVWCDVRMRWCEKESTDTQGSRVSWYEVEATCE
jgi:hypothetical protein